MKRDFCAASTHVVGSRRRFLTCSVAATAVLALPGTAAWAQASRASIRIGCTNDMSGTERVNTDAMHAGASVAFEAFNRAGGVNGRRIEIVRMDDKFKPGLAVENAKALEADPSVLALLQPLGTQVCMAVIDAIKDMAIVAPNTGTPAVRAKPSEVTFFVRADYHQEIRKLVETAAAQGLRRLGAIASMDPLGEATLKGLDLAVKALGLPAPVIARTPPIPSMEVGPAALEMAEADPQVVLVFGGGTVPAIVAAFRGGGGTSSVYGMSIASSQTVIDKLGEYARGFGFSMVVPAPFSGRYGIARDFQRDAAAAGVREFSLPAMEGYINARVLIEGLRRAPGGVATRESLLAGLRRLDALDLGGFKLGYAESRRGSNFVDVGVVDQRGRILS